MIFYAFTLFALVLIGIVGIFLTAPLGADGEGPLQLFFMWCFRTFGTAARDIRKFVKGVDALYLRRFYVSPRWLASWLEKRPYWKHPSKIFLHHIMRDDDDRASHDHPWKFLSIILWGSYRERILSHFECEGDGPWVPVYHVRIARPGSVLRNRAQHTHRVEIIRPVWSLVFAWPARRVWGFWTQENDAKQTPKWVPWRQYLGIPSERDSAEDVVGLPDPDAREGMPLVRVTYLRCGALIGTALDHGMAERVTDRSEEITKRENMEHVIARARKAAPLDASLEIKTYESLRETARRIALSVERKGE